MIEAKFIFKYVLILFKFLFYKKGEQLDITKHDFDMWKFTKFIGISLLVICLLWLLRHINRVKYACKQAYFASICMALNSYQSIMIAHVPYEPTLLS